MEPASERQVRASERVPLHALIELRCNGDDELLQADAIDLSTGGLAMRAPFLPPVGARIQCDFPCPPMGDAVRADAEVVWAEWEGPQSAAFGMRFVSLDTRSATAIRRLVAPAGPEPELAAVEPEPPGVAELRIEGLGAPIEADLCLDQSDRLVLQQALPFLRLGRRVAVDVPGRPARKGRIAAVELQHRGDEVPTLTFGVLLDGAATEASVADVMPSAEPVADPDPDSDVRALSAAQAPDPVRSRPEMQSPGSHAESATLPEPEQEEVPDYDAAPDRLGDAGDTWPEPPSFEEVPEREETPADIAEERSAVVAAPKPPRAVADAAVEGARAPLAATERDGGHGEAESVWEMSSSTDGSELDEPTLSKASPAALLWRALTLWFTRLRSWLAPRVERAREQGKESVGQFRADVWPSLRDRASDAVSKGRDGAGTRLRALGHMRKRTAKRRTTAPPPKSSNVEARRASRQQSQAPRLRGRLVLAGLLAFAGVGLAVYALAPRPAADDLQLQVPVDGPAYPQAAAAPAAGQPAASTAAAAPAQAPAASAAAAAAAPRAAAAAPAAKPEAAAEAAPKPSEEAPNDKVFGAAKVPRGRTYTLRMNNEVESLEGDEVDRGFVVQVPGALSLDRASPIAISHTAVARSMILNRGDHSELTIEFIPGKQPAYQVKANGRSLEITLERL